MASFKTSRTVCVIGAGPSGLVAAKTLVESTQVSFDVTVFEAKSRIGGLWPSQHSDRNGLLNPHMRTNQSRHTVAFSDCAWNETVPIFPFAWQVGVYLEKYRNLYPNYKIEFNRKVLAVRKDTKDRETWLIKLFGEEAERKFDYVVIATGFFGEPKLKNLFRDSKVPVWHSSQVKDIGKGEQKLGKGKNIVIVGGQMSGVETAAALALQISDDNYRPNGSIIDDSQNLTVIHVVKKPIWVMPLILPQNPTKEHKKSNKATTLTIENANAAPNFLPLDLVMYNFSLRSPGPVVNNSGHISEQAATAIHNHLETYIGNNQSEFGITGIAMKGQVRFEPPYLSVSDSYIEFVRQGKIKIFQGKLITASEKSNDVEINDSEGNFNKIRDVAAIVCATGFDATASIDFLSEDILKKLDFDPDNSNFPLILNIHSTISRSVPSLGFVGFYRSPYWGVMEMQARFLAKFWAGDEDARQALEDDQTSEIASRLRIDRRVSQFPMGDYAYLMEDFSKILGIRRSVPDHSLFALQQVDIVLPQRYLYAEATALQKSEAEKSLLLVARDISGSLDAGRFLARAVFRGLQGIWCLKRSIISQIDSYPSGTLTGTAVFHSRYSSLTGVGDSLITGHPECLSIDEYLYTEEGDFEMTWGGKMRAKRSYIWRYDWEKDNIEVWFTKADHKTPDYFFHTLIFERQTSITDDQITERKPWIATSNHLCVDDLYNVIYTFFFRGASLQSWSSDYIVKGPKKDYKIRNTFVRP